MNLTYDTHVAKFIHLFECIWKTGYTKWVIRSKYRTYSLISEVNNANSFHFFPYRSLCYQIRPAIKKQRIGRKILRNWPSSVPDLIQDIDWEKDSTK